MLNFQRVIVGYGMIWLGWYFFEMMFSMIPSQSWLMESFLIEFSTIYMVGKRWKPEPPKKKLARSSSNWWSHVSSCLWTSDSYGSERGVAAPCSHPGFQWYADWKMSQTRLSNWILTGWLEYHTECDTRISSDQNWECWRLDEIFMFIKTQVIWEGVKS